MQSLSYSSGIMGNGRKTSTNGATSSSLDAAAWRAVATRDASADGRLFYGVTSTGV